MLVICRHVGIVSGEYHDYSNLAGAYHIGLKYDVSGSNYSITRLYVCVTVYKQTKHVLGKCWAKIDPKKIFTSTNRALIYIYPGY